MKRQSRLTIAAAFDAAAIALETKAPIPEPARLVPVGLRVTVPGSPWQVIPEPHALRIAAKRIRTGPAKGAALPRMPRCPVADALRLYGDETTAAAKIIAHCDAIQGEADPADITRWRELAERLTRRVYLRERLEMAEADMEAASKDSAEAHEAYRRKPSPKGWTDYLSKRDRYQDARAAYSAAREAVSNHEKSKPKSLR